MTSADDARRLGDFKIVRELGRGSPFPAHHSATQKHED